MVSRSRRTSGSAFSVMSSEQLVCCTKTWASPQSMPAARTTAATSAVMSRVARGRVVKLRIC